MHAPLALHAIRPRRAHQLGIGHRNAGGVPRHVDLRHHANAARRGISHHLPHLLAGVELAVAGLLLQFGIMLGGKAPALIVGQVPVEHVKLGRRHAVELAENVRQRQEMARRIQQDAAPREARHIADIHQRQEGVLPVGLQQLQQGFHAAQRAEAGVGGQRGALRRDRQPVTFVAARQRLRRHPVLDHHLDRRAVRFFHRRQRPAGLQFDALAPARQHVAQVVTLHA